MTRRFTAFAAAASLGALLALAGGSVEARQDDGRRVFRSRTDLVTVSVTVKRGKSPVANLTAADFRLYDNDVAQKVDAVSVESVPLDVTLFMDTSGSTSGALDRMKQNVRAMAALLRPGDRVRLLTIGVSVEQPLPWQPAGRPISLEMKAVPGISLIYDALLVAFAHQPDPGRRHLIVAMTDAEDCGSLADGERVLAASRHSEAVLHWIYVSNSGDMSEFAIPAYCTPDDMFDKEYVTKIAEGSGGGTHRSRFGDPAVRTFRRVLEDFRQSYVLRYSPTGVTPRGWHALRVEVPARNGLTINARSGYLGR